MADITVTASAVQIKESTAEIEQVQFGEAVTAGEAVYLKAADSKYWLANNSAEATAAAKGIVLQPAGVDEYGLICTEGKVKLGSAVLTKAEVYIVSGTSGGIAPVGDLASADYLTILGHADDTNYLDVKIHVSGVAKA